MKQTLKEVEYEIKKLNNKENIFTLVCLLCIILSLILNMLVSKYFILVAMTILAFMGLQFNLHHIEMSILIDKLKKIEELK